MRRIGPSAVALIVLLMAVPAAHADNAAGEKGPIVPEVAHPQIGDSISEAELQDLKAVAARNGLALQDAIDRYAWNDNFALMVSTIRDAFPSAYAGAEIVDAQHAWVAFAGPVPDGAVGILDSFTRLHSNIVIEVRTELGFTEVDLETAIATVHYAVFDRAEVRDASTSFDFEKREIRTVVDLQIGVAGAIVEDITKVATDNLIETGRESILDSFSVSVVESNDPLLGGVDSSTQHVGGEVLSSCTSGFVIRNSANARRVTTAGHCPPPNGSQSDDGVGLPLEATHEGTHGDFQRHNGPQAKPDDFYAGTASVTEVNKRDVAAIGAPVVGMTLCKNGRTNHMQCQKVRKLNVCRSVYCNLVQMEARLAAGGDSGGPVFWGNTAYGLHEGWQYDPFEPFDRDLFSRADRIDNAFSGWNIATS